MRRASVLSAAGELSQEDVDSILNAWSLDDMPVSVSRKNSEEREHEEIADAKAGKSSRPVQPVQN